MRTSFRFWYIIYSLLAIGISIQLRYLIVPPNDNNYKIFAASFFHLLNGQDLYQLYPDEHFDLYKYTPTFALCFSFLAVLPETAGLMGWNLINVLVLLYAIAQLPYLKEERKHLLLILIIPELVLTIQNAQSNALITGLLLCSFTMAEKKK